MSVDTRGIMVSRANQSGHHAADSTTDDKTMVCILCDQCVHPLRVYRRTGIEFEVYLCNHWLIHTYTYLYFTQVIKEQNLLMYIFT